MLNNKLSFLPGGALNLQGPIGQLHARSVANRYKKLNWALMVSIFRERSENDGGWRGEFWGKNIRGAILSCYITQDEELRRLLRETVYDMLSTQTPDGCISSVDPARKDPNSVNWAPVGYWDVWSRKYVMLGLCRYCEYIDRDPKVITALGKMVDHLMTEIGPDARDCRAIGNHEGMASCSILGAIVRVWRLTGDQKHLDYAKWIANSGCSLRHNIFEQALAGVHPCDIANGKGYEMTSCYQGLSELALECDDYPDALPMLLKYYEMVRDREIYITGVGGGKDRWGEFWNDSALKQTSTDSEVTGTMGETCVITTWLHYIDRAYRLTGDAAMMDEAENAVYNALIGATLPDGTNCCHQNPTPLAGPASKIPAFGQIEYVFKKPFDEHDCCRSQYHEGLAMGIMFAVMAEGKTPLFNLYEDMTVNFEGVKYTVTGNWPSNDKVQIALSLPAPKSFAVKLRVPARESGRAFAKVGGETYDAQPGSYLTIERTWQEGDVIELTFDNSLQKLPVPYSDDYVYYKRGAIVMATDSRPGFRGAIANAERDGLQLCDYASAGNAFTEDNKLQVIFKK